MIPVFDEITGNLPPGVHEARWEEVVARYGYNQRWLSLLAGLKAALDALRDAGCSRAYIDGSFVTAKDAPGDFDACWEEDGVNPDALDPVLLIFQHGRAAQKAKFEGELFPAHAPAGPFGPNFSRVLPAGQEDGGAEGHRRH